MNSHRPSSKKSQIIFRQQSRSPSGFFRFWLLFEALKTRPPVSFRQFQLSRPRGGQSTEKGETYEELKSL
jgi:hypothetical protein